MGDEASYGHAVAGARRHPPAWREGPAKQPSSTSSTVSRGDDGSEPVPVEERVAVFDNDGTLWIEKPMPIQLDFILRRLVEMADGRRDAARSPAVEGRRTRATTAGSGR